MVEALLQQAPWLTPAYLFLLLNFVIATILISSAFSNRLKHIPTPPALLRTPSLFSRVTSFNFSNYHQNQQQPQQQQPQPQQYHSNHDNTSSSSFFSRVASFNFSSQAREEPGSVEPTTLTREIQAGEIHTRSDNDENLSTTSFFSRVTSFNLPGWDSQPGKVESATLEKNSRDPNEARSVKDHVMTRKQARQPYLLSRIKSFTLQKRDTQIIEEAGEVDAHSEQVLQKSKKQKEVAVAKLKAKAKVEAEIEEQKTESKKRNEEDDAKADDFINRFKQQLKMQRLDSFMRYKSV